MRDHPPLDGPGVDHSSPEQANLLERLDALARDLAVTRSELSRLTLDDVANAEIPTATAELFAIVAQTEGAANLILDGCETLDRVAELLAGGELLASGELLAGGERLSKRDAAHAVFAATRHIYAACGFHDLTGQRVTKVVDSLAAIEAGIAALATVVDGRERAASRRLSIDRMPAGWRHGPHAPADALLQGDVDVQLQSASA